MTEEKCFGKDKVIFVTKEQQAVPLHPDVQALSISLDDDERGPVLANGEINWNCPCLGGMVAGPCGYDFRQAFGCFHKSTADPRGSDCMEQFSQLNECLSKYPNLYGGYDADENEDTMNFAGEKSNSNTFSADENTVEDQQLSNENQLMLPKLSSEATNQRKE
ncbi:Mitochondrial intermembrane space import and assembly protein 40 [Trichinella britovi]|uniref:Mitochondrial intermembrane space import and assembly protein 40 n=2 Tax=Trichinella TaxID=6333 RepID=A0A0V1D2A7_TRIBR|nr:Mitochondrial intermembrane space import and assembly protein 40 [Trichinella murrelli]KRY55511.1 Mitochondrial intermembrane space import and assembly protein 40 [Trichinella britovi]KRZ96096.1 Mitochondrial intermembrane space import and assembly protein 40 [Trichinella sp. T8]